MNKAKMQRYVEATLNYLEKGIGDIISEGEVEGTMVGKVASFGPTVYAMGLKPAVMLYSKSGEDQKADRRPVVNAIYKILQKLYPDIEKKGKDLCSYVRPLQDGALANAKEEILDICVALKLALRTFPTKSKNPETGGDSQ